MFSSASLCLAWDVLISFSTAAVLSILSLSACFLALFLVFVTVFYAVLLINVFLSWDAAASFQRYVGTAYILYGGI